MVDHPDIPGIPAGAPISVQKKQAFNFKEFCKVCLSIVTRWHRFRRKSSPTSPGEEELEAKFEAISHGPEELGYDTEDEKTMNGIHSLRYNADNMRGDNPSSPRGFFKHKSMDGCFPNISSPLSRTGSRKSPSLKPSFLKRNASRRSTDSHHGSSASLSRNASRNSTSNIMFSNSTGKMKPPAIERPLECTLDELCYGCMKKIKITRDVITNTGQTIQEEEILTIKVKPGWKKGTKITFEGMGNERRGSCAADIIFVIAEKRHSLFRREGEDLEIGVEIPLVKALTGCQISIPLLGGKKTSLLIDDIIYPGYERIIEGQGMPNTKEQGKRGSLKVVFLVEFPTELTDEQRSDILSILQDSS
ncbi:dnaJ [Populus alba x Populus x berolinensis]|uniref:Chaperone DnaJ C-terminal domain-containing protein n=4 Tax=Populus TaxID=3689 RepID=A0A4U5R5T1_POPAL|nr:dnaJ homolog subfamily B member 1-like [Populus alba]KAG6786144.1 hypothetical protein POTOM_007738 [Populus tomentosa]KAJ6954315.1 dnaJ [Populus alba x Populus x berolinensis]KAJ7006603.1 dnaJ [Populus alba x Populus x berolinensis]TKS18599.1 hypothetical protein D5086_0000002680 [Populus alba]